MSLKPLAALALALVTLPACSQLQPEAAHASVPHEASAPLASEAEIAALFDRWNATLQNGGPHDMALLYAEDGVLLPTVSNVPRTNRVEIAEYFEHFLALEPRGTINERYIQVLDENTAMDAGVYTFDILRNGVPTYVVARYTFVYERIDGRWRIVSHHSSAMPEPVTSRPPRLQQVAHDASGEHGEEAAHGAAASHGDDGHGDSGHGDSGHGDAHAAAPADSHGDGHGESHGAGH